MKFTLLFINLINVVKKEKQFNVLTILMEELTSFGNLLSYKNFKYDMLTKHLSKLCI